jgi:hypothetical protein
MAERIIGRLQTPVDSEGKRYDIHPITDASALIWGEDSTLRDVMENTIPRLSRARPSTPGWWLYPISKEAIEADILLNNAIPTDEWTGQIVYDEDREAVILNSDVVRVSVEKPDDLSPEEIWAQDLGHE